MRARPVNSFQHLPDTPTRTSGAFAYTYYVFAAQKPLQDISSSDSVFSHLPGAVRSMWHLMQYQAALAQYMKGHMLGLSLLQTCQLPPSASSLHLSSALQTGVSSSHLCAGLWLAQAIRTRMMTSASCAAPRTAASMS